MGMRQLESAVLAELRRVTGKRSLRLKDIAAWSMGEIMLRDGEVGVFLPQLKINCALKRELLLKPVKSRSAKCLT